MTGLTQFLLTEDLIFDSRNVLQSSESNGHFIFGTSSNINKSCVKDYDRKTESVVPNLPLSQSFGGRKFYDT